MFGKYSLNFWLTCLSMLFIMISFNLIMPEMNGIITDLGGGNKKGLIITVFTISAAISRPFSGKLADFIGRKKVILIGFIMCSVVALSYSFAHTILFFLLLRFFHGFSVGFAPTGATALITDILPIEKRGTGMGVWGTFISLGIGVGQVAGTPIANTIGINWLFITSFLCVVISLVLLYFVSETLKDKVSFNLNQLIIKSNDVIDVSVIPSAVVMFLTSMCSGVVFVLTPDISEYLGISNKGWFFLFYVLTTIFVRLFTGTLSDRIGRRQSLLIGVSLLIVSMLILSLATNILVYTIASIIFGLATGVNSPSLFAWTADLSDVSRRGVGAGTMFIALEVGIMTGSFLTLFVYDNTYKSASNSFLIGLVSSSIAFLYLVYQIRNKASKY